MAIPGGADDVWRTEMDGVIFILFLLRLDMGEES